MTTQSETRLGAAILGMYAAIKLSIVEEIDPIDLLNLVRPVAEHDLKRDRNDSL